MYSTTVYEGLIIKRLLSVVNIYEGSQMFSVPFISIKVVCDISMDMDFTMELSVSMMVIAAYG